MLISHPEIFPDDMIVGGGYIVEYGSTQQRMSSRGLKPRHITVIRMGDNREMEFYKPHMDVKQGVWVLDHYDNDTEKFFYLDRFHSIQPKSTIDDLI